MPYSVSNYNIAFIYLSTFLCFAVVHLCRITIDVLQYRIKKQVMNGKSCVTVKLLKQNRKAGLLIMLPMKKSIL